MNSENNTEKLYDWMQSKSFDQLDAEQKKVVLSEMDAEQYDEMYASIQVLDGKPDLQSSKARVKQQVFDHFDQKSKKSTLLVFLNSKVRLGYAAVWIALLAGVFFWLLLRSQTSGQEGLVKVLTDTVYVDVPVTLVKTVHDTVTESRIIYVEYKKNGQADKLVTLEYPIAQLETDLHIVDLADDNSEMNRTRNNSLKYDSLADKIGFVTL